MQRGSRQNILEPCESLDHVWGFLLAGEVARTEKSKVPMARDVDVGYLEVSKRCH